MNNLIIPENYKSSLDLIKTQKAIKLIKDYFQINLSDKLNLIRVSAPLFVDKQSGFNDNLSGSEIPVSFNVLQDGKKWERLRSWQKLLQIQ